jgi:putative copper export protein
LAAVSLAVDPAPCCSVRALLLASMAALSGILNPSFLSSLRTTYGQVLLAKLAIFGVMLLLAAGNRYWPTPSPGHHARTRA